MKWEFFKKKIKELHLVVKGDFGYHDNKIFKTVYYGLEVTHVDVHVRFLKGHMNDEVP